MADVQLKVQKALTREELDHMVTAFQESINGNTDLAFLSRTLDVFVKEITPAKEIHFLLVSQENDFEILDIKNNVNIDISSSQGLIRTCLKQKKPRFVNDVNRYSGYDEKIDNIFKYDLKNLLIMPLQDIDNNLFAILWAGIPKGDLNQYIREDIDHVIQLLDQIVYTIPEEKKEEEIKVSEIVNHNEKKNINFSDTSEKQKVESPILIKTIQSWLSNFKKSKK